MKKTFKKILIGGGVVSKSLGDNENMLQLFMLSLFILLIKGLLVMVTYNWMMPKIIYNANPNYNYKKFRSINFLEAILLVILFTNLFNHF
tara:strand:- start:285 stop:554 length:270 start_codon:yes stop_codon:yes gene_type:complete